MTRAAPKGLRHSDWRAEQSRIHKQRFEEIRKDQSGWPSMKGTHEARDARYVKLLVQQGIESGLVRVRS